MKVLVIDGQGGGLGRQLVKMISERFPAAELRAAGTNSTAVSNMLKGGRAQGASGENAVLTACRWADVIVGPIGIVIADALLGEVTPAMAKAVGESAAIRILIPLNRCETLIAGVKEGNTSALLEDAMEKLAEVLR